MRWAWEGWASLGVSRRFFSPFFSWLGRGRRGQRREANKENRREKGGLGNEIDFPFFFSNTIEVSLCQIKMKSLPFLLCPSPLLRLKALLAASACLPAMDSG